MVDSPIKFNPAKTSFKMATTKFNLNCIKVKCAKFDQATAELKLAAEAFNLVAETFIYFFRFKCRNKYIATLATQLLRLKLRNRIFL